MVPAKAAMGGTTMATRSARRSDVPPGSLPPSARHPPHRALAARIPPGRARIFVAIGPCLLSSPRS
jgi:hypothetical protein